MEKDLQEVGINQKDIQEREHFKKKIRGHLSFKEKSKLKKIISGLNKQKKSVENECENIGLELK